MTQYTVIDLEMTGISTKTDKIIEIGAVRMRDGKVLETYSRLINPKMKLPERITTLTGITDEMLLFGQDEDQAIEELLSFWGDDLLVGHNIRHDYGFLKQWAVNHRRGLEAQACDTLKIARALLPKEQSKKLEALCAYFGIERQNAHRALDDAMETAFVFEELLKQKTPENELLFRPVKLEYKAKRQTPATQHQIEQIKSYRANHGIEDEISWQTLTRSEASRLMDHYYSTFGR